MLNDKYHPIPSELTTDQQYRFIQQAYELVPDSVRAVYVKGKGSHWQSKQQWRSAPWMQLHIHNRHWLMIDFDSGDEWHWQNLPMKPNVVCYNTDNGNHQVFYLLRDAVHCQRSAKRSRPYKWLRTLEKAVDAIYGGDTGFGRAISKNPFHPRWDSHWIHDRKHTLRELHQGLVLNAKSDRRKDTTDLEGEAGRNNALFNKVRLKCYREVPRYKQLDGITYEDWHRVVLDWCRAANNYDDASPLDHGEVISIAKSISAFCWYVYQPRKNKTPPMTHEQIKAAQSQAAHMTNAKQVGRSEAAIKLAIQQLQDAGKKPSKAAVARLAGLSRKQVTTKYSHLF